MVADMAATTHFKRQIAMGEMGDRLWFLENAWPRQVSRNTLFINTPEGRFLPAFSQVWPPPIGLGPFSWLTMTMTGAWTFSPPTAPHACSPMQITPSPSP